MHIAVAALPTATDPEHQVRLVLELIRLFDGPPSIPGSLKKKRPVQDKALGLSDFCAPIQFDPEKDLFIELWHQHSKTSARGTRYTD